MQNWLHNTKKSGKSLQEIWQGPCGIWSNDDGSYVEEQNIPYFWMERYNIKKFLQCRLLDNG